GARLVLTLTQSSWMVLIFSIPIFAAFAITSISTSWFLLAVVLVLIPLIVIAGVTGSLITSVLMAVFPARRVREMLVLVGAVFVGLLVFVIRAQQPEKLLNPRAIYDVAEFFSAFRTPSSPMLPTTWATAVLSAGRTSEGFPLMSLTLLWSTAAAAVVIGCWTARALYLRGYSRAQESRPAKLSALPLVDRFLDATTKP
ncbi:MAG: hypothetical protein GY953_54080, partial [bacterium]|nr:hypothetical protein [bacterium]